VNGLVKTSDENSIDAATTGNKNKFFTTFCAIIPTFTRQLYSLHRPNPRNFLFMSDFVVSARKYRPQRFEDVVGQQHIAQTLKNALATDHVAHAFLFCGPRGVGKTTCARILAKILNCQNRTPQLEACNQCSSCTGFNDNASFNIIELDAASNNSVENIRGLVEQVRFPPQQGKYKVFIIDEVHMLSNAAFNAFLKTLEEPPPYAIFILATTEKHKIIPTILSRCQIFDFRRITPGDMVLHLQGICRKEGIEAEDDALHIIGQKADGALRDALSIFDRITSASLDKRIRYADVIDNLNVLDYDYYFQITDALMAEDRAALLNLFDQILRKGFEADIFINGLAEHLRNILVCKDPTTLALLEVGDNLRERYQRQAALAPVSFLLSSLNCCNDCDINYKMARHKRLHVEMALLKMCHLSRAIQATRSAGVVEAEKKNHLTSDNGSRVPENPAPTPVERPPAVPQRPSSTAVELSKDQMNHLATEVRMGLKKADLVSLSLDAFEQAVVVEDAANAARESRLNLENAQLEWRQYSETHPSPTLRQAMNAAKLHIDDKKIIATVALAMHRGLIQEEMSRLLDILRARLQDGQIILQIKVDEARLAEMQVVNTPKRPLSNKERLDQVQQHYPLISELIRRFDLRMEE
jgi:DNA polymerase III subunit gamma/tau